MKKYTTSIKTIILGLILAAGSTYLLAATWTGPQGTAPTLNVTAPINVSSSAQAKTGLLGLSALQFNPNGSSTTTPGYVMTAIDNFGDVAWRPPATSTIPASTECLDDGYMYSFQQGSMDDWGANQNDETLELYCRNHTVRWCLSGHTCPWRNSITSDDADTCYLLDRMTGVGSEKFTPNNDGNHEYYSAPASLYAPNRIGAPANRDQRFNPQAIIMAYSNPAGREKWKNYTWYLCSTSTPYQKSGI